MDDIKVTMLVLIEFSKVFNTVCRDILLAILSYLMISSEALGRLSSYLQGRQQCVRIDSSSLSWCDLITSIPKGCILTRLVSEFRFIS